VKLVVAEAVGSQLAIPDGQLKQLREYYGFDKPLPVAYGIWLYQTVQLNLGQSFRYNEPVLQVIVQRLQFPSITDW